MREFRDQEAKLYLDFFLSHAESEQIETKRVSGKMVGKALETVCAFANTRGGWLILGIEDFDKGKGIDRLYGVSENPEAVDELLRKLNSNLQPPVEGIESIRIPCRLRDGEYGHLIATYVPASDKVHTILDGGTWKRGEASNRQMNASEITELSYRRGERSAESEAVDVDFTLLNTEYWRLFHKARGFQSGDLSDQLYRIGLAKKVGNNLLPVRAAVLLFAEEPGALLAGTGTRADVRVFHYRGNTIEAGEIPNLKKSPKTISGPLYRQIGLTHAYLLDELADGLTLAKSGFRTVHRYPERVIKEAITNSIIHRDYRLNRDIQIRIFDSRIEVVSPGLFPGRINAANIARLGSFARNPLIALNLREFPEPPNVDAAEGVRMMFSVMQSNNLFPPVYQEMREQAQEAVAVKLINEERPPMWEQVNEWIERNGPIANSDLCKIATVDTLTASKMLKRWVEQGVLVADPTRGKRNMVYYKPVEREDIQQTLLFTLSDNKPTKR